MKIDELRELLRQYKSILDWMDANRGKPGQVENMTEAISIAREIHNLKCAFISDGNLHVGLLLPKKHPNGSGKSFMVLTPAYVHVSELSGRVGDKVRVAVEEWLQCVDLYCEPEAADGFLPSTPDDDRVYFDFLCDVISAGMSAYNVRAIISNDRALIAGPDGGWKDYPLKSVEEITHETC